MGGEMARNGVREMGGAWGRSDCASLPYDTSLRMRNAGPYLAENRPRSALHRTVFRVLVRIEVSKKI